MNLIIMIAAEPNMIPEVFLGLQRPQHELVRLGASLAKLRKLQWPLIVVLIVLM